MRRLPFLSAFALFLVACVSTAPAPALPHGDAIGKPMAVAPSVRFALVDAEPAKYFHRSVLVEGTVRAVCQNSGCWMQIEDQGRTAIVRWETGCGGAYSFPKDAAGKHVLVQGSFRAKEMSQEELEHLQEESGGKVAARRDGYEFTASSVLLFSK
jgi:hypothetical protein